MSRKSPEYFNSATAMMPRRIPTERIGNMMFPIASYRRLRSRRINKSPLGRSMTATRKRFTLLQVGAKRATAGCFPKSRQRAQVPSEVEHVAFSQAYLLTPREGTATLMSAKVEGAAALSTDTTSVQFGGEVRTRRLISIRSLAIRQ